MITRPELHSSCLPGGSDRKTAAFLLHPPLAHCSAEVSCRQCLPWDEHIIFLTQYMRDSSLIQYGNGVLHMPVHKIHAEVGATIARKVDWWGCTREDHPVLHQGDRYYIFRSSGCSTSWPSVLPLYVGIQGYYLQICFTLHANDPTSLIGGPTQNI